MAKIHIKILKREAMTIPSLDALSKLHAHVDKEDGYIVGEKWEINDYVIRELKSKGYALQEFDHPYLKFEYWLRKTKHADELRHKG